MVSIQLISGRLGHAALEIALLLAVTANVAAQTPADGAYGVTGPISGYMDFHFNKPETGDGQLDFHRFVLIFSHTFAPRIRFVAELELEHAVVEGLEEKGAVEL